VLEFMAPWSEPCNYMRNVLDGNPKGIGLANELQDYADFYELDITKFRVLYARELIHYLNN
jgi:thiol-disulfide isomerase/thioredoxin